MIIFGLTGFIFSRVTYTEQYSSQVIFNVSNKDKDIAGSASLYVTQSDAQASGMIANNFKNLIENGNDLLEILGKVKEIGFDGVEFAGYQNVSAEDLKKR